MGQPLLLTGEPGSGKTRLAYRIAWELGLEPVLTYSTKSTSTASDLFYTYDYLGRFHAAQGGGDVSPELFIRYHALGEAIIRANPKADVEKFLPPGFVQADTMFKIQTLLLRLAARGHFPDHADRLRNIISPLVCTGQEEQRIFRQAFNRWLDRTIGSDQAISKSLTSVSKDIKRMGYIGRGLIVLAILLLIGLAAALFWSPPVPTEKLPDPEHTVKSHIKTDEIKNQQAFSRQIMQPDADQQVQNYWILGGVSVLFVLIWLFWMRIMADRHISRHYSDDDVDIVYARVSGQTNFHAC